MTFELWPVSVLNFFSMFSETTIENINQRILQSYPETTHIRRSPYTFEIIHPNQRLFYFGAEHSHNMEHPQFTKLESYWRQFEQALTPGSTVVVLTEGDTVYPATLNQSKGEAINHAGEGGLASWLAVHSGFNVLSPEPSDAWLRSKCQQKGYSLDEIQYYYYSRYIDQANRMASTKDKIEEIVKRLLKHDEKHSGWSNYSFTFEHMVTVHRTLFPTVPFDITNQDFFHKQCNPTVARLTPSRATTTQKVSALREDWRDPYIVAYILHEWEQGNSIFVVFSHSHAKFQEPAIKYYLEQK